MYFTRTDGVQLFRNFLEVRMRMSRLNAEKRVSRSVCSSPWSDGVELVWGAQLEAGGRIHESMGCSGRIRGRRGRRAEGGRAEGGRVEGGRVECSGRRRRGRRVELNRVERGLAIAVRKALPHLVEELELHLLLPNLSLQIIDR